MNDKVTLTIDGIKIQAAADATILDAARANSIDIPTLCHDSRVETYGACGLCVVEAENSPKLMRACATKVREGMVINTHTPRVISSRKIALELLLSDHDGDCRPPCALNCPAGTDCQGYVGLIANGEYKLAVKLIKEKIPIPASIGRVCPHPCETACRRKHVEEPVSIAWLKSFAADMDMSSGDAYVPEIKPDTGKTVSIIGGGPGGLSVAFFLRAMGHSVKIYDKMPQMGGMLRYGIPQYRLPKDVLDKEIAAIEDMGVELINNYKIGRDISLEQIKANSHAVVVANGAWLSGSMGVKGEDLLGVIGGIDFLREVSLGNPPEIGDRVAVCGGGNTAMDACRTAVRLGAKEVYIVYRRTKSEMPAAIEEIDEAEEEGVIFKYLTNPDEILSENGKVYGMRLQVMELGEPDASGRRSPVPVEGEFEELELDTVIMAIGQKNDNNGFEILEKTRRGTIVADENSFRTSVEGIFAIGDSTNGGASIAIAAIGEAQKASLVINSYLNGKTVGYKKDYVVEKTVTAEDFADREKVSREKMPKLSPEERKHNFNEIVFGYTEEAAQKEAARCLECGCHDYYQCKLYNYANKYDVNPARFKGEKVIRYHGNSNEFIERNPDKCVLCGLCVRACTEVMDITAIGLMDRGFNTTVSPEFNLPLDKTNCNACGLCVRMCPTGALQEKTLLRKQVPVKETIKNITCNLCDKKCTLALSYVGDRLLRVMPDDEGSLKCHLGREELIKRIKESV
ncbi:MAG: FAD-dependent oxidoreductase [Clostridiales bacterium]|nr:FAD-dependent oxidoreductase [Clostridiales bacterium]